MAKDDDDCDKDEMMMMAYQHITTSHITTRFEYVLMMKGGNMTVTLPPCIYPSYKDDHIGRKL